MLKPSVQRITPSQSNNHQRINHQVCSESHLASRATTSNKNPWPTNMEHTKISLTKNIREPKKAMEDGKIIKGMRQKYKECHV